MGTPMENSLPYDPVRMLAWKILQEIERSSFFADFALDQAFFQTPDLKPLDRAMISEMVMGVLRWRGRLDVHLQQLLKSRDKKVDARLMQLLRLNIQYAVLAIGSFSSGLFHNECHGIAFV